MMRLLNSLCVSGVILCLFAGGRSPQSASSPLAKQPLQSQPEDERTAKLSLRVSALKDAITSGDALGLRVEIWNEGTTDIFVCKDFERLSWPFCNVSFSIENSTGRYSSQYNVAIDSDPREKVPLTKALSRDWIALRQNHYYGTTVKLDPASYPQLREPGRYQILGQYGSSGFVQSYHGSLLVESGELEHLQAISWQGQIDAKAITIRVLPAKH
jgi:hypothetical protein